MAVYMLGILVPVFLSIWFSKREKKSKDRAVTVEVGGEKGLTKRNWRFEHLLETPWEGADTLAILFEQTCARHCDNLLLGTRILISRETEVSEDGRAFEKVTLGHYEWTTYGQAFRSADDFASGLVAIGHEKGERVAIFAETRAEWFLALQACFRRNLTVVTIYASLGEEALVHSLNEVTLNPKPVMYITHCFLPRLFILPGTMFVEDGTEQGASTRVGWEVPWQTEVTTVVCDHKQLKKLVDLSRNLDTVKRVVYMEDYGNNLEPSLSGSSSKWTVASFSHVQSLGRQLPANPDMPLAADIAVIMYTSGSTGLPKGVMMSHRNMVATVAGVTTMVPGLGSKDVYLAYLPLAHVLEIAAESTLFAAGAAIGYGSPLTMTDTSSKIKHGTKGDVTELRPTLMTAVPAILDRVREGVRKKVKTKGGFTNTLFQFAYKRRLAAVEGSWLGAWGLEKHLWNAVVFRKIRSVLGGRVRGMLSGGAPLSGDTQRFINVCFGVPILQGYGLTETCAGATFCEWDDTSVGRVGPPVPQCYLKLVNWEEGGYLFTDTPMPRGEIVIGGPSVTMGYFKNTVKTEEVYKVDENGMRWFYTGDIGCFHQDGCVEIIDRKKDIVKLQHGEYVSLGKVEAVLSGSRYVDSIMLYADPFHSHCIAIIVAAQAALEEWANDTGVQYSNFADLCSNPATIKEVLSSISKVAKQAQLQKFEVPTKIKLLHEAWTPETGLVTAALKIKREVIRKTFADDLKNLYQ